MCGFAAHQKRILFHGGQVHDIRILTVIKSDNRIIPRRELVIPFQSHNQRNRNGVGLTTDCIRELIKRQQRGQGTVGVATIARHFKHLPVQVVACLSGLTSMDETLTTSIDRGIKRIGGARADVHDVFVTEIDEMLRSNHHALVVVNAYGGIEIFTSRRIDTNDRHTNALELLNFTRIDGEGSDEYCIHIATYRQSGEEPFAVLSGIDMLEQ